MIKMYATYSETLVSALPANHPWHRIYGIKVTHGTTGDRSRYRLTLCAIPFRDCVAEIPGVPLSTYPYGDRFQEDFTAYVKAMERAHEIAPRVTVNGVTVADALTVEFPTAANCDSVVM